MEKLTPEEAIAARDALRGVVNEVEKVIVGKRETVEMCAVALLARGHVLIEDVPGVGKTMLAKALARAIGCDFKRIQFTPDLLPGDVTGLSIFNPRSAEFSFLPGPVFTNVLLADEINRATPKTQSALLEAMEEAQVTADGVTRALDQPFFVMATQNPVEYRGTYPLPEAQMDRFLLRLRLGYPSRREEVEMIERHVAASAAEGSTGEGGQAGALLATVLPVLDHTSILQHQKSRARVHVSRAICEYVVDLVHEIRANVHVALGASPRAALSLQRAAQAAALMAGREYVMPDDIKKLAPQALAHRLILHGDNSDAIASEKLIHAIVAEVAMP